MGIGGLTVIGLGYVRARTVAGSPPPKPGALIFPSQGMSGVMEEGFGTLPS
jgi:hypothetical protein